MLSKAKRIVVKVGSSLLIDDKNHVRAEWLKSLVEDIDSLKKNGTICGTSSLSFSQNYIFTHYKKKP